jgi:hypothetical protein
MRIHGQYLPLVSPGRFLKLAAHEWLISANGEARYTLNSSRSRLAKFMTGTDELSGDENETEPKHRAL